MNLILFERNELEKSGSESGTVFHIFLKPEDLRAVHLGRILKAGEGTVVAAGLINGKKGKAEIIEIKKTGTRLLFTPQSDSAGLHPITLLLGLSRPPTIKKVLKEATALGVERFIICGTENGEQSYRDSSALRPENIRNVLVEGAQQAYCTMLPEVEICYNVKKAVAEAEKSFKNGERPSSLLALDNYEAEIPLSESLFENRTVLAVGSERGWTAAERDILRAGGYTLCSLGKRVLRTETAAIAGIAVCLSGMGLI